jgi:hypothetical protein
LTTAYPAIPDRTEKLASLGLVRRKSARAKDATEALRSADGETVREADDKWLCILPS